MDQPIMAWATEAGFSITRCSVESVEEMPMDAVFLEAEKT